ncbi:methyltransferase domain-containing protein [Patescibacteria group bacterium]
MLGIKILEKRRSKFNGNIEVIRSLGFGTYIQVGGITQSGGVVGDFWKKTLRMIKISRKQIRSVLILGLGGGTAAGLARKYWPKASIVGVEIDPVMVELGTKYLKLTASNPKIIVADAYDYCLKSVSFDLVLVDLYNGDKFPKKFEEDKFLRLLTKNKCVIVNRLYFKEKKDEVDRFVTKLGKHFSFVERFFPQANIMLVCYNK